jgi:hypothetical protein
LSCPGEHGDTFYGCCVEPYPTISYSFKVRRHARTYVSGILLPMVLATYAGFLAFAANPDSGERIGLGITVMLCAETNHWFGGSPPNFRTLYLGQIDVDSADFWTNRLLSSDSRSAVEESGPNRSITRTLKSG